MPSRIMKGSSRLESLRRQQREVSAPPQQQEQEDTTSPALLSSDKKSSEDKSGKGKKPTRTKEQRKQSVAAGVSSKTDEPMELLSQYRKQHGHCNVPQDYEINGVKLGVWLQNQSIPTYRDEAQWLAKLKLLQQYRERNGHCRVPHKYEVDGAKLGVWLQNQRQEYKKHKTGKPSKLTQERIDQLEAVGVDWDAQEALWQSKFELLRQYKQAHGHCRVPAKYEIDGVKLGLWLQNQRLQYKKHSQGKTAYLSQARIDALKAIGHDWNPRASSSTATTGDEEMTVATGKRNASVDSQSGSLAEASSVVSPARQASPNKSRKLNDGSGVTVTVGHNLGKNNNRRTTRSSNRSV